MQDMEDDADINPLGGMAGDGTFARVSHTMDVSVDLSNSSHYDANDASQSFSIWTEDSPGTTNSWYFILPNVSGKKNISGRTYDGVAIKLTHGTLISWDGRLIRHCTSVMDRKEGCHVYGTFFGAKTKVVHYGVQRAITSERQRRAYAEGRQRGVGGDDSPIVDIVPASESNVILDNDDIGFDGSVSSVELESDAWIGALGEDLGLGDETHDDGDDSTIDEGVPVSDAIEAGHVSDSGLWDEPAVAAWRIPRRWDGERVDESRSSSSSSQSRSDTPAADRHVPDLMAQRTECWSCVACESLYSIDSGEGHLCRDALRFVSSGGPFRETVDARETHHLNQVHQMNQQRLRPFCPFVPGLLDGNRVHVRVYYPYFRVQNGDVRPLFDVFHPRKVTALHLIRASRVLVPCPHLQFHFEEFWKLLLPEFTTLRTGIEWIDDVAWYYIQMVRCNTKYPHILSLGWAFDTWIHMSKDDWVEFNMASSRNVMVGVSGDREADARMVAIESLTPGTYLGGKMIYFPSVRLRDVFARKFEPFLPDGTRTCVGQRESDGSASRPHALDHGSVMYYFMVKVVTDARIRGRALRMCDDNAFVGTNPDLVMAEASRPPTCWSREVRSGAQTKYDEDDEFFCYNLNSEMHGRRFNWYEHRFEAAKDIGPTFQWASLQKLSNALCQILSLRQPGGLGQYGDRGSALATATLIEALHDAIPFGLRFAMVFDRMCLCVKSAIPCLTSMHVCDLLSAFASMIITNVPEVIPRYAFACDDAFLFESLALNIVDILPFRREDALCVHKTFRDVMQRLGVGQRR